ncbi:hypothetical protein CONLIGDRAFT_708227 [Coniochaeta ligniaria NRRL 30616]|uniref:DUF6604 domain-containing protein n=1 Tax=Coniochaeta ligniaria NRRL 30616 TaxID=1408157 RepID=A0A1J7IDQ6_9PEZI|nr:hypothetical protein CONLIGDRAFT_708227 [Coniochaeta ligniaria NRRL 30616]
MPLPPSLTSTYRQYKHDTDVVASWLAHMGRRIGCPDELLASAPAAGPTAAKKVAGGRLKGKARKQAKAGPSSSAPPGGAAPEAAPASAAPPPDLPKYVLAIKNFVPLAEFIGSSEIDKYKVDIPHTFVAAIERAISVRRAFASLLQKQGIDSKLKRDAKHSFFVGVLERVRDLLKPLFWKSAPGGLKDMSAVADALSSGADVGVASQNPFDILKVYDTPDIDLGLDDVSAGDAEQAASKGKEAVMTVDYKAEEADSDMGLEMFLAFCTLFRDVNAIRTRVKSLWTDYDDSKLKLSAVAIATNTAIDLARRMEEDVAHLFANVKDGMHGLLYDFYTACCVAEGKDAMDFRHPDEYNMSTYGLVDYTMNNSARSEKDFDWDHASNRDKWQQDKTSLMEVFPEFDMTGRMAYQPLPKEAGGNGQVPIVDEMTRGMHLWMASPPRSRARELSLWLILATSIHLDIRRVLKEEVDLPYFEMKAIGNQVHDSIQKTIEYHKNLRIVGWTAQHDKGLRDLQHDITYWHNNPVHLMRDQLGGTPVEENLFLKRHPWYCGLWIHDVRTRFHTLGLALERAFGGILYSGHLYNALEREQLISQKWEDMELFYNLQGGRDKFFVGAAPADAADYHKQLCMVMGFSAAAFTGQRDKRNKGKMEATKAGPRSLKPQGRVSNMWLLKPTAASPRLNSTAEDVKAILEGGRPANSSSRGNREDGKQLSPAEMITDLAHALHEEVAEIAADYFAMHRTCWSLLRLVRAAVYGDMVEWVGPKFDDGEYQLPFIVGWIFRSVCGDAGGGAGSKNPGIMPTMELLQKAARTYNEATEKLGEGWTNGELQRERELESMLDRFTEEEDSLASGGTLPAQSSSGTLQSRLGLNIDLGGRDLSSFPAQSSSRTHTLRSGTQVEVPQMKSFVSKTLTVP